jgi:hypothetical protein
MGSGEGSKVLYRNIVAALIATLGGWTFVVVVSAPCSSHPNWRRQKNKIVIPRLGVLLEVVAKLKFHCDRPQKIFSALLDMDDLRHESGPAKSARATLPK